MTQIYVKGERVRRVQTPKERVDATWAGFKPLTESTLYGYSYSELQAIARILGVQANQKREALVANLAGLGDAEVSPSGERPEPDTGDQSPVGDGDEVSA